MRIRKAQLIHLPNHDCITFERPLGNGIYDSESWIIDKSQLQDDEHGSTKLIIPIDEIEELKTTYQLSSDG